ncbi:MAG: UDP-N-acetylmuramoyl-tripeptide--D-alanyl-D-alanine ligase [Victivallales bacterium]|jgi:UDP-N-acetylmuramoyl-tripeptide--D-alanyl-D-alanine ligase
MTKNLFTYNEMEKLSGGKWSGDVNPSAGIDFISTDSRKDCRNSIFFALKGENFDAHDCLGAAAASGAAAFCLSKRRMKGLEIPPKIPVLIVKDTLEAYQKLARQHRKKLDLKLIALTGSSGKTSTKEILKAILVYAFGKDKVYATLGNTNNHFGVPQNLLGLTETHKYAIIEMGSNHPGEIEVLSGIAEPDMGIVVSIGNAHIEFFGSLDGVAKEKSAIFAKMNKSGTAVIPAEGSGSRTLDTATAKFKTLRFGNEKAANADLAVKYLGGDMTGGSFELHWKKCGLRKTVKWQLPGKHQAVNAGGAVLAANALGVSPELAAEALNNGVEIPGMRMRIQVKDGITWINDAYNANPDSMKAGIEWLAEAVAANTSKESRIFVILGDMLEMGDKGPSAHNEILKSAAELIPGCMLIAVGPLMSGAAKDIGVNTDISLRDFPNSEEAAKYVKAKIRRNDVIFLKGSRGMKLEKVENMV